MKKILGFLLAFGSILFIIGAHPAQAADPYIQNIYFGQDSQGDYISLRWDSIPSGDSSCFQYFVVAFFNRSNPNGSTIGETYNSGFSTGDFNGNPTSYSSFGSSGFASGVPNVQCSNNNFNLSVNLPATIKAYINPDWSPNRLSFSSSDYITVQLVRHSIGYNFWEIVENSGTIYYDTPANPIPIIPYDNVRFGYDADERLKISFDWVGPNRNIYPLVGFNGKILYSHASRFTADPDKDISMTFESGLNENFYNASWLLQGASIFVEKGKHYEFYVNELHKWAPSYELIVCNWYSPCPVSRYQTESALGRPFNTGDYITIAFLGQPFSGAGYTLNDPNKYYYKPPEPIIFVPGILGTKLNKATAPFDEVWPGNLVLTKDSHLDFLILSTSTSSELPGQTIKVGNILDEAAAGYDVYKRILDGIQIFADRINGLLIKNPYDWRMGIGQTANELGQKINNAAMQSESGKVTVIAHSMGGLLTREYLRTATTTSNISKIIFLGTPHLGAPKAGKLLLYGDTLNINFLGLGLNPDQAKKISQNFPSVYQLLPSKRYFSEVSPSYIYGPNSADTANPVHLNYDATKTFLTNAGLNAGLLKRAEDFHAALDDRAIPSNIKVYNIVGCGSPTIDEIILLDNDKKKIQIAVGDGTVPLGSATHGDDQSQRYYTTSRHTDLVRDKGPLTQILNILDEKSTLAEGMSTSTTICDFTQKWVSFATHSPVDLHVYDSQNRHLGPDANGDIEYGIPNSSYDTLGDNHFVTVPDSSTTTYRVVIDAYGSGSFDFDITKMDAVGITEKISFLNQPVATTTMATITYQSSVASPALLIDTDGNGQNDKTVAPTAVVVGSQAADITPPTITINSPDQLEYGHNEFVSLSVSAGDSESGLALFETRLNGGLLSTTTLDLFAYPLGTHTLTFLAFDRAGNPRELSQSFTSYADATSTIADIDRALTLGWIKNKDTRNDLVKDLKAVMKLEKKIIRLDEKLPPAVAKRLTPEQRIQKKIERYEAKIDKKLGKELLTTIENKYKKGLITIDAYNLLKADIEWMMR